MQAGRKEELWACARVEGARKGLWGEPSLSQDLSCCSPGRSEEPDRGLQPPEFLLGVLGSASRVAAPRRIEESLSPNSRSGSHPAPSLRSKDTRSPGMGGKVERSLAGDKGGGTVGRQRDGPDSSPCALPPPARAGALLDAWSVERQRAGERVSVCGEAGGVMNCSREIPLDPER